jgi:integrase
VDREGQALAGIARRLKSIDLHFHDLRHEAGSRLLEKGWPLHHVQHFLGHANISQTSTYLNVEARGLEESMRRFDSPALQSVASEEAKVALAENAAPVSEPSNSLIN